MYKSSWRSPSNIALIKYWGKYSNQIPANPSLSFTLDACHTETVVELTEKISKEDFSVDVQLDGKPQPGFKPKIIQFFEKIASEASFLKDHHISIHTHNSFPHSSGIASSASGMSALALCILSLRENIKGDTELDFFQKASEWSRQGSGSASRSVYGGLVEWGRFAGIRESSDNYAIPYPGKVHSVFQSFCDYVLLVETGSKKVSSTAGHSLMDDHPFAERRFLQAHENLHALENILETGDLNEFGALVESEALTLHAMMMSSRPYFILMKPNTIAIINRVWQFRKDTHLPLFFTLDAGANVHLLFPKEAEQEIDMFVKENLTPYLQNGQYIRDRVGTGPSRM